MITEKNETLFAKIGGIEAVNAAVNIFYEKVLNDVSIRHFFENTDMNRQIAKQKAFLAYVFGAPTKYTGKNMRDAHSKLVERGLNHQHFERVAIHLQDTLNQLEVDLDLIHKVMEIVGGTKNDVLGL